MSVLENLAREAVETARDPGRFADLIAGSISLLGSDGASFKVHRPGVVEFTDASGISFIGDIHGDFYSLIAVLENTLPRIAGGTVVFLGDYADRGYAQLESLALVLLLKKYYPERVVLLRGNHEPPEWLKPYPHDLPSVLAERFSGDAARLYGLLSRFFNHLPLIGFRRGGFIAVHGGPPLKSIRSSRLEEAFEIGSPEFSAETLESVLWSDPTELGVEAVPSPRGAGYLYGPGFTAKALSLVDGGFIVRGHEYVDGYKEMHGGRVITVFSAPLVYELRYAGIVVYSERGGERSVEKVLVEPKRPG